MIIEERKKQITNLVKEYYIRHKCLRDIPLEELIKKALDKFLYTNLTIDEIDKIMLDKVKELEKDYKTDEDNKQKDNNNNNNNNNNNDIRNSDGNIKNTTKGGNNRHLEIFDRLEEFMFLLDHSNVDYQLDGALGAYLKYGEEPSKKQDIKIIVNEDDIDNVKGICDRLGLDFKDNRIEPYKEEKDGVLSGEHDIIAKDPSSDFNIGMTSFERKKDGSVILKQYFKDENGNTCCRKEIFGKDLAKEIFNSESIEFRGEKIFINPPENIYNMLKSSNNEHNRDDIAFIESRMDKDKLDKLNELSSSKIIEDEVVSKNPKRVSLLDKAKKTNDKDKINESKSNEIDDMLDDNSNTIEYENTNSNEMSKGNAKVYSLGSNNTNTQSGYITNDTIALLGTATFIVALIGLILLYIYTR